MSFINKFIIYFFISFIATPFAFAEGGNFGLNIGLGLPFLTQAGAQFFISDQFSLAAEYNRLDLDVDEASAELTMPAFMVYFHPFSGSFFIGAGIGQETLDITATESTSNLKIRLEVEANTTIIKTGWMWGKSNGGFWFGVDVSYINPSGSDTKITDNGVPTSDPNYQDALEAAEDFGDTAYPNLTFARIGWIF